MDNISASTFEKTVILPNVDQRELVNDNLLVVNLPGTNESIRQHDDNNTDVVRKNSLSLSPERQKEGNKSHQNKKGKKSSLSVHAGRNSKREGGKGMYNRPSNPNPISYQQMVEGIVDQGVGSKYVNEILLLMTWASQNQSDWLCEEVIVSYDSITRQREDENFNQCRKRIKGHYSALLQNAKNEPVFCLEKITVQRFMEYLASQAHYLTGSVLKSGSYGTKRSAFRHMFRLHKMERDFLLNSTKNYH